MTSLTLTPRLGDEHLAEIGYTVHLYERAGLDPRLVHVDEHEGGTAMLRLIDVCAGQQHAPAADVGTGIPHLLAGDYPFVAVALGASGDARQVRTGPRLTEQLAPLGLATPHRAEEAVLLFGCAVREQSRPAQVRSDAGWWANHAGTRQCCADGSGLCRSRPEPAQPLGPAREGIPGIEQAIPPVGQGHIQFPVCFEPLLDAVVHLVGTAHLNRLVYSVRVVRARSSPTSDSTRCASTVRV